MQITPHTIIAQGVKVTGQKRESRKRLGPIPAGAAQWDRYDFKWDTLEGEATLSIDIEALIAHLGPKALTSKGRKAVEASGAVVVTVSRVRTVQEGEWGK